MKWQIESTVDAPIARVEAALFDPTWPEWVPGHMPLMEWAKPVSMTREGSVVKRVMHYRPSVKPPFAGKALTRNDTEFFEHFEYDYATRTASLKVVPNIPAQYLGTFEGYGTYRLEPRGPASTARIFDGVILFHVPIVGRLCEMFAISKLRVHFRHEGDLLNAMVRVAAPHADALGG